MSKVARAVAADIWANYDTFIFDADGVLWIGNNPIDGSTTLINQLVEKGKSVIVMSNNATRTPRDYLEKCKKLGFTALKEENIVSAGLVAAYELKKLQHGETLDPKECSGLSRSIPQNLPVYLVGSYALQETLKEYAGVESFGPGPDPFDNYTQDTFLSNVDISQKVSAVVGSFDPHISYVKIMKAANYLNDPNVHFIVTNEDVTYPSDNPNVVVPGTGCITSVLRFVSGRQPVVTGKPHTAAFNFIRERHHIEPKRTLMVGDRCDTDMWFGNRHGLDTLLVLSGIHNLDNVAQFENNKQLECIPKFYANSTKDLTLECGLNSVHNGNI
ncbi:haloacid dehalogenase-like hydrolase domain-containing protein [Ditylenchus destructor]|uniref:Haloacid dehalogenase-like hydrolase domain-containing protein n=1 Tax=Ditylenchus destructor TaxID=166010 RepID=A0AAD4NIP2_9BILA|nr:haloacid dehalogenase-like hydrolase domain-containing protein [Ditylenchus destructor]